jgi:hypothetical protein
MMNTQQAIVLTRSLLAQFAAEFGDETATKLYSDAIEHLIDHIGATEVEPTSQKQAQHHK